MLHEERNITWQKNHETIEDAFWILFDRDGDVPPVSLISEHTGISKRTIYKHYEEMDTSEITGKWKLHMERAMAALSKKAEGGDVYAIQLLAKLTGFTEQKKIEHTSKDVFEVKIVE